ncbi:MAG: hypothetical protein Q8O76_04495, partial [Chloroflexota bacterium]|nr:hypothetical protein [Chloroflexota bacterium]
CMLCQSPIKKGRAAAWVHVCLHCNRVLAHAVDYAPAERCPDGYNEDGCGGCGVFPVGSECVKRVPKEYRE